VPTVILCGRPGCAVTNGELDKAIIRRYLRRALPKIQYCYEKQLLVDPTTRTSFTAEFLIQANGRVQRAIASGGDPAIGDCVADVIQAIEFPPSHSATEVHYPFTFDFAGA
jgi:hypothetical protein